MKEKPTIYSCWLLWSTSSLIGVMSTASSVGVRCVFSTGTCHTVPYMPLILALLRYEGGNRSFCYICEFMSRLCWSRLQSTSQPSQSSMTTWRESQSSWSPTNSPTVLAAQRFFSVYGHNASRAVTACVDDVCRNFRTSEESGRVAATGTSKPRRHTVEMYASAIMNTFIRQ